MEFEIENYRRSNTSAVTSDTHFSDFFSSLTDIWTESSADLSAENSASGMDNDFLLVHTSEAELSLNSYPSPDYDSGMSAGDPCLSPFPDHSDLLDMESQSVSFADLVDDVSALPDPRELFNAVQTVDTNQMCESETVKQVEPEKPREITICLEGLEEFENTVKSPPTVSKSYNFRVRGKRVKDYEEECDNSEEEGNESRPKKAPRVQKNLSGKHTPVSEGLSAYLKNKQLENCIDDLDNGGPNRSAIQARINRQKKKAYISTLEQKNSKMEKDNKALKEEVKVLSADKRSLEEEVRYLKSVLAQQSTLSSLLKNIPLTDGIRLSSSFSAKQVDHDYGKPTKRRRYFEQAPSGGVCLHVRDSSRVSLEFCAQCSRLATMANNCDDDV